MHQDWDPVMLEEYLRGEVKSREDPVVVQSRFARRSVLSRSFGTESPTVDVRRSQPTVDLTFD